MKVGGVGKMPVTALKKKKPREVQRKSPRPKKKKKPGPSEVLGGGLEHKGAKTESKKLLKVHRVQKKKKLATPSQKKKAGGVAHKQLKNIIRKKKKHKKKGGVGEKTSWTLPSAGRENAAPTGVGEQVNAKVGFSTVFPNGARGGLGDLQKRKGVPGTFPFKPKRNKKNRIEKGNWLGRMAFRNGKGGGKLETTFQKRIDRSSTTPLPEKAFRPGEVLVEENGEEKSQGGNGKKEE